MKLELYNEVVEKTKTLFSKAHIVLNEKEKNEIEVADFGLNDVYITGLELVTYMNTDRCCAKELVLLPLQTCPEHYHPPFNGHDGKEETFRCRYGVVYLYVEGKPSTNPYAKPPVETKEFYTVWHEIVLHAGDQYTIFPNTKHWFQGGADGAVVSEFSTKSFDEEDIFTNPNIIREALLEE